MTWQYPVVNRQIPDGGAYRSDYYIDGGVRKKRSAWHSGVDWGGFPGQEIRAIGDGEVVKVATSYTPGKGWGYHVWIHHGGDLYSGYAHMRDVPSVRVGQRVSAGTLLGYVGKTGEATGNHLHFAMARGPWAQVSNVNRTYLIDPLAFLAERVNPAATEAEKARVRRNAAYLNGLGLASYKTAAEQDGIPIDPPVTSKTISRYYNLVQLWAASRGLWHDSYGPPYLTNTQAAEKALNEFLDNPPPVVVPEPPVVVEPPVEPEPPVTPPVEPDPEPTDPGVPEPPTEPEPPVIPPVEEPVDKPQPRPVTPEDEEKATELANDLLNGNLDTGNAVVAKIRTFMPILMGPVIAWLSTRFPSLAEFLNDQAEGWQYVIYGGLSVLAAYGYWSLAKFLGSRTWFGRDWSVIERIMLGSSSQPVYVPSSTPRKAAVKKALKSK